MKRGGSIAAPIPSGVPVRIIVPGTSLQKDTQSQLEPNTHNQSYLSKIVTHIEHLRHILGQPANELSTREYLI